MTEAQTFFTFLVLCVLPFWLPDFLKKYQLKMAESEYSESDEEPEESEIDLDELEAAVKELLIQIQEIQKMQNAIAKIDSCKPGIQHSSFQLKWQSEDGKNQNYDFWADGDSRTNDLLRELYQTEIDNLTTPLSEMTEIIYNMTHAEWQN